MAGGQGERLWPLSTARRPKQFQRLLPGRPTPFEQAFQRALALVGEAEGVWTVTRRAYADLIKGEVEGFAPGNIIAEPCQRNTAPCLALAAALIIRRRPQADVLVAMPADHFVADQEAMVAALKAAVSEARRTGSVVCLGVTPTGPHTGYGYIEVAEGPTGEASQASPSRRASQSVRRFTEKPAEATAKGFVASGRHFWNAGLFVWPMAALLAEFKAHAPEMARFMDDVRQAEGEPWPLIEERFASLPEVSIDYALMERSTNIRLVPVSCGWNDLGSFSALAEVLGRDSAGNAAGLAEGAALVAEEAHGVLLSEGAAKRVVLCGLKDALVVDTPEALLVCGSRLEGRLKELGRQAERLGPPEPPFEWRPWGMWERLALGAGFQVKRIIVKPGQRLSLQAHQHRAEHWVVLSGRPKVEIDGQNLEPKPGQHVFIPREARHRLANPGPEEVVIIEVQLGEILSESDITRFEDDYGR